MSQKRNKKTSIKGTAERPRLSVFRSSNHIYAQIIDDKQGVTLVSSSSLTLKIKGQSQKGAFEIGKILGDACSSKKIKQVIFDRGRYIYSGRVKALAEGAREAGLEF